MEALMPPCSKGEEKLNEVLETKEREATGYTCLDGGGMLQSYRTTIQISFQRCFLYVFGDVQVKASTTDTIKTES